VAGADDVVLFGVRRVGVGPWGVIGNAVGAGCSEGGVGGAVFEVEAFGDDGGIAYAGEGRGAKTRRTEASATAMPPCWESR